MNNNNNNNQFDNISYKSPSHRNTNLIFSEESAFRTVDSQYRSIANEDDVMINSTDKNRTNFAATPFHARNFELDNNNNNINTESIIFEPTNDYNNLGNSNSNNDTSLLIHNHINNSSDVNDKGNLMPLSDLLNLTKKNRDTDQFFGGLDLNSINLEIGGILVKHPSHISYPNNNNLNQNTNNIQSNENQSKITFEKDNKGILDSFSSSGNIDSNDNFQSSQFNFPNSSNNIPGISDIAQQLRSSGELRASQPEFIPRKFRLNDNIGSFNSGGGVDPLEMLGSFSESSRKGSGNSSVNTSSDLQGISQYITDTDDATASLGKGFESRVNNYYDAAPVTGQDDFDIGNLNTVANLPLDTSGPEFNFSLLQNSIYELAEADGDQNNSFSGSVVSSLEHFHYPNALENTPFSHRNQKNNGNQLGIGIAHMPSPLQIPSGDSQWPDLKAVTAKSNNRYDSVSSSWPNQDSSVRTKLPSVSTDKEDHNLLQRPRNNNQWEIKPASYPHQQYQMSNNTVMDQSNYSEMSMNSNGRSRISSSQSYRVPHNYPPPQYHNASQQTGYGFSSGEGGKQLLPPRLDPTYEPVIPSTRTRNKGNATYQKKPDNKYSKDSTLRHSGDSVISNTSSMVNAGNSQKSAPAVIRSDSSEFPRSKAAYKEFFKEFRRVEKDDGESAAKEYAIKAIATLPESMQWRVYLELADLAKRNNSVQEARLYYAEVCGLQPREGMGWLEWSKMEEENGQLVRSLNILVLGLKVCRINETLLTRVIRLHEKLHKPFAVRGMLSALRGENIDKIWKSVLEGTLFESRAGNISIARRLFSFLMDKVQWYGPIYYEAFRLEEKEGNDILALDIIKRGLEELPRYGPLWFGLMRVMERNDVKQERRKWQRGKTPTLQGLVFEAHRAIDLISKELVWKVHFELSQALERAAEVAANGRYQLTTVPLVECRAQMLKPARMELIHSLIMCPANLRWRVLLAGVRLEIGIDQIDKARVMLRRAFVEAPLKSKSNVYIECSRLEEYCGDVSAARYILNRARSDLPSEWKIYLESILVEVRNGNISNAIELAGEAVESHRGTGRLWAVYIQLYHRLEYLQVLNKRNASNHSSDFTTPERNSIRTAVIKEPLDYSAIKTEIIKKAINAVPKSGEVWCEKSRCHLNPLNLEDFDIYEAQLCLRFAIQFTPQYGDTFIEYVRLEMITQVLLPAVLELLSLPIIPFIEKFVIKSDLQNDLASIIYNNKSYNAIDDSIVQNRLSSSSFYLRQKRRNNITLIEQMNYKFDNLLERYRNINIKILQQRCMNADPNYGSIWFFSRRQPYDISSTVLSNSVEILSQEIFATQDIYARAIVHFIRKCLMKLPYNIGDNIDRADTSNSSNFNISCTDSNSRDIQRKLDQECLSDINISYNRLTSWPRINELPIIPFVTINCGTIYSNTDFITGIIKMNRNNYSLQLKREEKFKILFSSDQIVS